MKKIYIGRARQAGIYPRVPVPPPLRWSRKHHHRRYIEHTFFGREKCIKNSTNLMKLNENYLTCDLEMKDHLCIGFFWVSLIC